MHGASSSSSTNSERDERVFVTAFGMMDSHQDGEAVAAFMQVRAILHRHGGGFRRLLERSHEAEKFNEELGQQNQLLLRENAALRARDSRPASARPPVNNQTSPVMPAVPEFRHWDLGLIGIILVSTNYGLLGFTASLTLIAAILICAAFANWFSPIRFFAGVVLGLAALGSGMFNRSASADSPAPAVVDTPTAVTLAATGGHALADAAPPRPTFSDPTPPRQTLADTLPTRRILTEPRTRHAWAPRSHCGIYRLQPGYTCPRSTPWRRDFFPDFGRLQRMRYD
jgi:hypothetical protein